MPVDRPGEADQPVERPEQPERFNPERFNPERFNPEQRAQLDRLAETSARWADLDRYDGKRANLPDVDRIQAAEYVRDNLHSRPWLEPSSRRAVDIQRVIASMDQGNGHQLERHEGHTTDDKLQRRVTALEDPAQLDRDKRAAGIDGVTGKNHYCGTEATSIQNPEMFATAFARGIEHPKIRQVLDSPYERDGAPAQVRIPIEDLLGPEGHQHCSGYRLVPVDGSLKTAHAQRRAWFKAGGEDSGLPPPEAERIDTFENGHIVFRFAATRERDGWEIRTMFPEPEDRSA